MIETRTLQLVVSVAQTGNFSKTASQFEMVPSNVSKHISSLEQRLDTRLFYRTTRKVSLTEAGSLFVQQAQRILDMLDKAEEDIRELQSEPSGNLVVQAPTEWGREIIAQVVCEFIKHHPKVKVQLVLDDSSKDFITSGIDVFFRGNQPHDGRMVAKPVMSYQYGLVASEGYIRQHGLPQSIDDLKSRDFILYQYETNKLQTLLYKKATDVEEQWQELTLQGTFSTNSGAAMEVALKQGLGIAIDISWQHQGAAHQDKVAIMPEYEFRLPNQSQRQIWLIYPNKEHLSSKVRAFVDFVGQYWQKQTTSSLRNKR